MEETPPLPPDLWHTFLGRHRVSLHDQDAFLDYLVASPALPIDSLEALEAAYREFLRRGLPPSDRA